VSAPRFQDTERPRALPPWHRLAHIARILPRELEALARTIPVPAGGTVLDLGAAEGPYRHFFPQARWLAADLPGNPAADLVLRADGTVPLEDGSVDAVLSTQVLEHAEDPALHLRECARVLRPGGRLLLSTHGIMVFHPDPDDLWRWTHSGLRRIVSDAGLEVERLEGIMGLTATGIQLAQDGVLWRLPPRARPAVALAAQTLARLADRAEPAGSKRLNALVFAVVARRP
jgi:SAM-dependent methyltransferase